MQLPGLRVMKLLMKQSLSQADRSQMCEQRIAVFRAKCSPSTPEQKQSLFPHMELEGHLCMFQMETAPDSSPPETKYGHSARQEQG